MGIQIDCAPIANRRPRFYLYETLARARQQTKKRGLSVCKCAPNKRLIELTTRSRSLYLSVPEVGHTRTAATHSHFIHHHPHPHCAIHHARTPLFRPAHYRTSARVGCIQPIDVRQKKTLKTTPTNHWLITQRNAQARARVGARQREQLCHVFDGASARAALIIERPAAARPRALIKVNSIYPTCPFVTRRRASARIISASRREQARTPPKCDDLMFPKYATRHTCALPPSKLQIIDALIRSGDARKGRPRRGDVLTGRKAG